jgi:hypothetical protein
VWPPVRYSPLVGILRERSPFSAFLEADGLVNFLPIAGKVGAAISANVPVIENGAVIVVSGIG